jgi:DNA-binding response OmpR family regulator
MANVKKILVVDDDPDIVDQVTMILKQDGHEVHSAGTQNEAEEMLLSFKPDLAILDLMMEDKDSGFVLCHRIKKLYPNTPVMMVTAVKAATGLSFAADSALQQSWLKADLLVDKPIRAEVLRNDVNGLLNRAAS